MTGSKILAMGHYQPSRVLTNADLAKTVDTNDTWIRDRVGIAERRIAEGETVADMASAAAGKALANSGLTAADIDLVVVATCSSADRCPNVATRVASKLGIAAPSAFDLNTACSGFSYALATADHAIRAGAARNAIVIGAEKLSEITDWTDRSTAVLFGDGAGAAILAACAAAGITPKDLAAFVPHQANLRIIEPLARKLGVDNAVVARDIIGSGNTSAASIPLALSKMLERREVPSGAPILLFGFGGGLTYAGQVVRCP